VSQKCLRCGYVGTNERLHTKIERTLEQKCDKLLKQGNSVVLQFQKEDNRCTTLSLISIMIVFVGVVANYYLNTIVSGYLSLFIGVLMVCNICNTVVCMKKETKYWIYIRTLVE